MEETHNQRENHQRREVSKRERTGRTNLPPITVMAKIPKRRIIRVSRATMDHEQEVEEVDEVIIEEDLTSNEGSENENEQGNTNEGAEETENETGIMQYKEMGNGEGAWE